MATIAIRGHETRGKEVIEILEMLGGKNQNNVYSGKDTFHYYFIDNETGYIRTKLYTDDFWTKLTYNIFTLEEFFEKFPYKVGDRVKNVYGNYGNVYAMKWIDDEIQYRLNFGCHTSGWYFVNDLQPHKEETKIVLEKKHNYKLKLESTKKVREYWSKYTRIFIEIYDDIPNECVLTHLYTLKSHRQKGYGKQALSEAESIAKELGCHTAYIKVETDSWMYQWYLRCGYQWYKNADKEYTWLTKNLT